VLNIASGRAEMSRWEMLILQLSSRRLIATQVFHPLFMCFNWCWLFNQPNNNNNDTMSDFITQTLPPPVAYGPSFSARPDGRNVLPEYRHALQQMVINPRLMRHSSIHTILRLLTPLMPKDSFETTLRQAINFAFSGNQRDAYISVDEIDYHGNLTYDIQSVYRSYSSFEKKGVHTAIHLLVEKRDSSLRSLLGLLARGQHECSARRRMAFSTLMIATKTYLPQDQLMMVDEESEMVNTPNPAAAPPAAASLNIDKIPLTPEALEASQRIYSLVMSFIEERKDQAYRSVFVEPTLLFYRLHHDSVMEGDVDVHGSNYYLALIEATTGIRLPRVPLWDDTEVKGVADYLHTKFIQAYPDVKKDLFDLHTEDELLSRNSNKVNRTQLGRSLATYESTVLSRTIPNLQSDYQHVNLAYFDPLSPQPQQTI
jgi:hypothetical protein